MEQLLESGINTFINLTEDLSGGDKLELYDPFLPSSCIIDRFPVKDVNIPTNEFMVKILDAIDAYLEVGHVPYIHC